VYEISGASVVEVENMRVSISRAVDVAAVEFQGALFVAFASETSTSSVLVYLSGNLASPTVISVGQSALFTALFASNDFIYAVFCSVSSASSTCNIFNVQELSAYLIQTLAVPHFISSAEVFSVSSGQIFLAASPKIYLWNSLLRLFAYHSDVGSDVSSAKLIRVGSSDVLVTFAPNSSKAATSAATTLVQNPPQSAFLASQGALQGKCYMRAGEVAGVPGYSRVVSTGNIDTWNVVFSSLLIVANSTSVYREFSNGTNQPSNGAPVNPAYSSDPFGGRWSDDVRILSDVADSTRITGRWGGDGTDLTALFKLFEESGRTYLVELGWVMLDEGKQFDRTLNSDTTHLRWPFDPTWSVPEGNVAPYRCYYNISSPVFTPASSSAFGQLRFRLFDPVSIDFVEMPSQPGHSLASGSLNSRLFAVWTSGSKLFAAVGGFGTFLTLKSFSISQIATGLSDFIDMQMCKPELGFASLFVLSADSKNTLSWYELNHNGTLTIIKSLQPNGLSMIRCRTFSVTCDAQIAVLACSDGLFVVSFSRDSRSLVSGKPLLAKDSLLYSSYLSSITSLSFVSRSGTLPIVIAASHSKGFVCSVELVSQDSSVRLSDVIDVKLDGVANFFQWVSQPSVANFPPLLNGSLPSKNLAHTDSYSFSFDDTYYLVTFSRCDILVTSQATLYAMNNITNAWVSLGPLPESEGACNARFCDGGNGMRYLTVAVNHLNEWNYVQSSHIYRQTSSVRAAESSYGGVFSFFTWEKIHSTQTKGAVNVLSMKAPDCVFLFIQEGDGIVPGPIPSLLLRNASGTWSVANSNLFVSRSGFIVISSEYSSVPDSTLSVKTSFSSLSSNSRFFSALNSVVGLMIFGLSNSDSQAMSPFLVAQELWLVNCTSVALFSPFASAIVIVSVSCPELSHVFVLKQSGSTTYGLTQIGSYPASFSSAMNQRCSDDLSCTTYLAFLSSNGVGLRIVKDSQVVFANPLPSTGFYGDESSLAASSQFVDQTSNVFQRTPQATWKMSSVSRSDGDFFAVFDDLLHSEFLVSDARNPRLSLRGITALSNSFRSYDNSTLFGALSVSPPRVSLFQISPSGKFELKSSIPASLSRFAAAKELDVSADVDTSLLKVVVGTRACDVEQDQNIKLFVSASDSLTRLLSTPPSINMLGVLSATLKDYAAGSGTVNVTAIDSFGASTSVLVNVVVDSVANPLVTVLSPVVTIFVSGLSKQTVTSVLSSKQSIGATISYVVLNVTNPSMFSIQPLFTSLGNLVCGTTASESVSELTVASRSFLASRVFQSEPVKVSVIFRLVNRPPVPIVLKQVIVPMNSGPLKILNVVSCNMSADGKDVGQVLLRYNFQSIEELTGSIRQPVLLSRISATPSLSVDGTLFISFATSVVGNFQIYFTATDSGGVASGGVDTSLPFAINVFVQSSAAAVPVIALPNNGISINVRQNSGFNSARFSVSPGLVKRSFATILQVNASVISSAPEGIIFNVVAGVEGSLNFTVKSGLFGSAVVKVVATDSDNLSGSANFVVNVLNTDNIRPSIVVLPYVALTQNPTASYVVPNFVLSASVGNDLFEQSSQAIISIDVAVDTAATAPGYFLTTPTVSFQGRFLVLNTRPGVFGRFVLKVTATDSGYVGNVSPESTVEGFIFAAPVILKVVPDMLSPAGGDTITVNGMHFGS
jgi:hypothetical protein